VIFSWDCHLVNVSVGPCFLLHLNTWTPQATYLEGVPSCSVGGVGLVVDVVICSNFSGISGDCATYDVDCSKCGAILYLYYFA